MRDGTAEEHEWFTPTSGRVTGVLALLVVVMLLASAVRHPGEPYAPTLGFGAAFAGVLVWAALLRPKLAVTDRTLVLRNMLETVRVPLAAVEQVAVRQVLAVRAGGKRYVSPAVGHSLRRVVHSDVPGAKPPGADIGRDSVAMPYAEFVASRIRQRCADARAQQGVEDGSDEQFALAADVRRHPAYAEIAALLVTGLGLVTSIVF